MINPKILNDTKLIFDDLHNRNFTHVAMTNKWWTINFNNILMKSGRLETVFSTEKMTIAKIRPDLN